jgi:hypothetical protein
MVECSFKENKAYDLYVKAREAFVYALDHGTPAQRALRLQLSRQRDFMATLQKLTEDLKVSPTFGPLAKCVSTPTQPVSQGGQVAKLDTSPNILGPPACVANAFCCNPGDFIFAGENGATWIDCAALL